MNVRKLREETGLPFILSSHTPLIVFYEDEIHFIEKGHWIRYFKSPEEIHSHRILSPYCFVHLVGPAKDSDRPRMWGEWYAFFGLTAHGELYAGYGAQIATNVVDVVVRDVLENYLIYLTREGKVYEMCLTDYYKPPVEMYHKRPIVTLLKRPGYTTIFAVDIDGQILRENSNGVSGFQSHPISTLLVSPRQTRKLTYVADDTIYCLKFDGTLYQQSWKTPYGASKKVDVGVYDMEHVWDTATKRHCLAIQKRDPFPHIYLRTRQGTHVEFQRRDVRHFLPPQWKNAIYWITNSGNMENSANQPLEANVSMNTHHTLIQWENAMRAVRDISWFLPREIWIKIMDYVFYPSDPSYQ